MAEYYIIPVIEGQADYAQETDSFRIMQYHNQQLYCELNSGTVRESWQRITEDEFYQVVPREPVQKPEPTEQEIINAELLLNQMDILAKLTEQDEVQAQILLNQMEVQANV